MNARELEVLDDIIAMRDRAVAAETERDRLRDEVAWLRAALLEREQSDD